MPLNPEILKAMKEATEKLLKTQEVYEADRSEWYQRHQSRIAFDNLATPANVSALIAEVERQAAEIERLQIIEAEINRKETQK